MQYGCFQVKKSQPTSSLLPFFPSMQQAGNKTKRKLGHVPACVCADLHHEYVKPLDRYMQERYFFSVLQPPGYGIVNRLCTAPARILRGQDPPDQGLLPVLPFCPFALSGFSRLADKSFMYKPPGRKKALGTYLPKLLTLGYLLTYLPTTYYNTDCCCCCCCLCLGLYLPRYLPT